MMNDQLYREIILEHWKNPQNFGEISNPDFEISDYNPLCGDKIKITGIISNGKVKDLKFTAEGCAISVASGSILTEELKHKSIEKIKDSTQEEYLNLLEVDLTSVRIKCGLLPYSALRKALKDI